MRKIILCGISGFIGTQLVAELKDDYELILVGRSAKKLSKQFPDMQQCLNWPELNVEHLRHAYVVINLAGANIGAKRWSRARKAEILDSRILTTLRISQMCAELGEAAPKIINASALGYYPAVADMQDAQLYTEDYQQQQPVQSFSEYIVCNWEEALGEAEQASVKVVKLRFAVVLGKAAGMLKRLYPSFAVGLGAVLCDGQQPLPWVDLLDVIGAIKFFIDHHDLCGTYNVIADEQITQEQFARTLAKQLQRPCILYFPRWFVKLNFGQMGEELLLSGVAATNHKLKAAGYKFKYSNLVDSLAHNYPQENNDDY